MKERNHGQGLLEFAVILPILVVVIFGVFDLGRLYFSTITLTSAAREGVRYLSVYPEDVSNTIPYSNTLSVVIQEAQNSGILITEGDISPHCPTDDSGKYCESGGTATVSITYEFDLILGWLLPNTIEITRGAQMVVP
jgi:hypothetical protein